MTWLTRIPIAVVFAHLAMIPGLQAKESLRAKDQIGVGTGSFEKDGATAIVQQWKRTAEREPVRRAYAKASPATLGGIGIGFRVVPPS